MGETMLSQDLIVAPTQDRPPALIEGSGRKARDRIEHFLRAAIDNDNTRRAYGRSLSSFFAFLDDGSKERVQDIGPLDVRDYLEAAKANGLSTAKTAHGRHPHALRPPRHRRRARAQPRALRKSATPEARQGQDPRADGRGGGRAAALN